MASKTSSPCDACRGDIGLLQATFTSECAHTFHLRCVSGIAVCPVCAAKWGDSPATAAARLVAGPFGQTPPPLGGSLFGEKAPRATQKKNPFWLIQAPPKPPSRSCSVCHGTIRRGQGGVTPDCNHTFHLRCNPGSFCPVCGTKWCDEVTVAPSPQPRPTSSFPRLPNFYYPPPPPPPPNPNFILTPPHPNLLMPMPSPINIFIDDEPVEPTPLDGVEVTNNGEHGVLVLKTHYEHPAVARDAAKENFAVLLHAKAPVAAAAEASESERAPLDLVTVLDVSGSMEGPKLGLLKQAMGFVIDHLGPGDRLSIVTFSCTAQRIIRLSRMTDGGKAFAKSAVESLFADGTTNIGDGLRVAAEVLHGRRHKNAVASVILLSDGQDNHLGGYYSGHYDSRVDTDGRTASVDVGELYADEERRFLLLVDVARERFRVEAAEDIAAAKAAAERGEHAKAAQILDRRREASAANAVLAGDARCAALVAELSARVADRREYEQTGRACLLAGMSSHAQQRAATVQLFGCAAPPAPGAGPVCAAAPSSNRFAPPNWAPPAPTFGAAYATRAMQGMVDLSKRKREQQQQGQEISSLKKRIG
nr:unnamed protein product [Digitaria exilis]